MGIVVSHPFARRKANGWGAGAFWGERRCGKGSSVNMNRAGGARCQYEYALINFLEATIQRIALAKIAAGRRGDGHQDQEVD